MRRGRREARRPRARAATARRRSRTGFVAAPAQRRSEACPGGGQGAIIARSTLREARRLDALVLDARYVSALTVVRSLGRRGVRVNAVEPGLVRAPMSLAMRSRTGGEERLAAAIPLGRLAEPG